MSFSDHKITAFTHRIADLPDQPNLPADELKARFDSSPEELRQSVNGICDDADRLEERVSGIVAGTFGDSIDKSMLSDELVTELNAKATQTQLAEETAARKAETTARESADSALSTRVSSLESTMPQKAQIYVGTYTGNGAASQTINLGFRPQAVLVVANGCGWQDGYYCYSAMAITDHPANGASLPALEVSANGFIAHYNTSTSRTYMCLNQSSILYYYIAFR